MLAASASMLGHDAVSPNGKLLLREKGGVFQVLSEGRPALDIVATGITTSRQGRELSLLSMTADGRIDADYQMVSGKRLHATNAANAYTFHFADADGHRQRLVFRLYNDGIAFRYELDGLNAEQMGDELTTYRIAEGTRRWMQQYTDSYEGFFPLSTTASVKAERTFGGGPPSADGLVHRWGYPALVEPADGLFTLITEADIDRRQSASSLHSEGDLFRVRPDGNSLSLSGSWHSPWRVAIIGTLANIVESTLVTDVSAPCRLDEAAWVRPGVVAWVYWAYNHGSKNLDIIRQYVDLAATLQLPYVLIDAEWDEMEDGHTIAEALDYAKARGVKPMIWYNSSVGWVDGAPGPKFRLNKPEDREREMAWCEQMGVAGVKVDFFSGDNQQNMDYCLDLMECAARHHLLINFHGATIPRGWQRTYPNLLTTEGVYGAEWYNNVPTFTNRAARHNATLPFTRNVVGPMDYTPCTFSDSQHPHITTHAHELALTVLFESGLQHLADRPESYLAQPSEVQQLLSQLPAAWDDSRLVDGYPGDYAVMARRSGCRWYVAGINGTDEARQLSLSRLPTLVGTATKVILFADGDTQPWTISHPQALPNNIRCKPRGGFLMVVDTRE